MTFGRDSLLIYRKNIKFFKTSAKSTMVTLNVHDWNGKDEIYPDNLTEGLYF